MLINKLPLELTDKVIRELTPYEVRDLLQATDRNLEHLFNLYGDFDFTKDASTPDDRFFSCDMDTVHWEDDLPPKLFNLIELTDMSSINFGAFSRKFSKSDNNFIVVIGQLTGFNRRFGVDRRCDLKTFISGMIPYSVILIKNMNYLSSLDLSAVKEPTYNRLFFGDCEELRVTLPMDLKKSPFTMINVQSLSAFNVSTNFIDSLELEDAPGQELTLDTSIPYTLKSKTIAAEEVHLTGVEKFQDIKYLGQGIELKFEDGFVQDLINGFRTIKLNNPVIENFDAPNCTSFTLFYTKDTNFPDLKNIYLPKLKFARIEDIMGLNVDPEVPAQDKASRINFDFISKVQTLEAFHTNGVLSNCSSFNYLSHLKLTIIQPLPEGMNTVFPALKSLDLAMDNTRRVPRLCAPMLNVFKLIIFYDDPDPREERVKGLIEALNGHPVLTTIEINLSNATISPIVKQEVDMFVSLRRRQITTYKLESEVNYNDF